MVHRIVPTLTPRRPKQQPDEIYPRSNILDEKEVRHKAFIFLVFIWPSILPAKITAIPNNGWYLILVMNKWIRCVPFNPWEIVEANFDEKIEAFMISLRFKQTIIGPKIRCAAHFNKIQARLKHFERYVSCKIARNMINLIEHKLELS
jgi:hypothetical protein